MKKKNTIKPKLVATIIAMVSALAFLAVGVMASLTNFQVAIANQLNLEFSAVEGTLYATRVGDVAGTDRTTSKVLSESTTATDWLKVYDGTTTEGVQNDALNSIQEKVDFVSNDKIKEIGSGGRNYVVITYYFYYTLPENAVANNISLTAPAVADTNLTISYSYIKVTSATLPTFDDATSLTDGGSVTISGGESLFIKAEARVSLAKSVKLDKIDWNFTLDFGVSTYSLTNGVLTFNPVSGAETYEVWAKANTASGATLLAQTSSVGDTDSALGTLVKVLNKDTTSVNLSVALKGQSSGNYAIVVVPKNASGSEITGNRVEVVYNYVYEPIQVTDEAINGNYFYYIELGEYPQTAIEDEATISALDALGDTAKTGRVFPICDDNRKIHVEYAYNGAKYVKVESADVHGTYSKFASGTTPTDSATYWFKVEPIKWILLEAYSATQTSYTGPTSNIRVISEKILTANIPFMDSIATSTAQWDVSHPRIWLNDGFYNNAFSDSDKKCIVTNTTRFFGIGEYKTQDDYTVTTGGSTSEDNVWLLSNYEASTTYYGTEMYLNKNTRKATPTDFAVVNELYMNSKGFGWHWLRSAGGNGATACYVAGSATIGRGEFDFTSYGVRPALTISL